MSEKFARIINAASAIAFVTHQPNPLAIHRSLVKLVNGRERQQRVTDRLCSHVNAGNHGGK